MVLRRLRVALAAALLTASMVGATPVAASNQPAADAPAVSLAQPSTCGGTVNSNYKRTGMENGSSTTNRSGIKATITFNPGYDAPFNWGFRACDGALPSGKVQAEVAVIPHASNPSCGSDHGVALYTMYEHCVIAVGVGQDGESDVPFWYYRLGGCNPPNGSPGTTLRHYANLSSFGEQTHTIAVYREADGDWKGTIDGQTVFDIEGEEENTSCWANDDQVKVIWRGEKQRTGDSLGDTEQSGERLYYGEAYYGRFNLGWFDPAWPGMSNNCSFNMPQDTCKTISSRSMWIDTDNP